MFQSGGGGGGGINKWTTGTLYAVDDIVYNDSLKKIYQCLVAHTSGAFLTDLAAAKWKELSKEDNGRLNWITNNKADVDTTGWATFDDGGSLVNGTGGSASYTTITRNTTDPLFGLADFQLDFGDTASALGEGISYDFSITKGALGRVHDIEFDYVTDTDYVDNEVEIWIYDRDSSVLIQPTPYVLKASTVPSHFKAQFQTNYNSTTASADDYRLIFYVNSSATTKRTINFTNVVVAETQYAQGPIETYLGALTTTHGLTGGSSTTTAYYWRIGDKLKAQVKIAWPTIFTGGSATLNLPSGYSIDYTKLPGTTYNIVGSIVANSAGGDFAPGQIMTNNGASGQLLMSIFADDSGTSSGYVVRAGISTTVPNTWINNDYIIIEYEVPILGWSSSTIMSDDADTRVVAANAYRSGNQTGVNPNNSAVKIQLNSVAASAARGFDTHAAFDTATNYRWTSPVSGYFDARGVINVASINVLANAYQAVIYVNNAANCYGPYFNAQANVAMTLEASGLLKLNKGDYVELFLFGSGNNSSNTLTVNAGASSTWLDIRQVQGPSAIAASEKVNARYSSNAATTFNNTATTIVDFEDKDRDTHGAVTVGAAWKFTAPKSDNYRVSAHFELETGGGWAATETAILYLYKNGVEYSKLGQYIAQATHTNYVPIQGSDEIYLLAGEYIDVRCFQNSGGNINQYNNSASNHISISSQGGV